MFRSVRARLTVAALVFALAWALGIESRAIAPIAV